MFPEEKVANGVKIVCKSLEPVAFRPGTLIAVKLSASARSTGNQNKKVESIPEVQERIANTLEEFIKLRRDLALSVMMPWIIGQKRVQLRVYFVFQ